MKFQINAKKFREMVAPAADIALKNVKRLGASSKTDNDFISLRATPEELVVNA